MNQSAFRKICRAAANAAAKYGMLAGGDRVVVGISGGMDSLTLMHVLYHLQKHAPFAFELFPVCVDMDFPGFDRGALDDYCHSQGWNVHRVTIPGQELLRQKDAETRPCSLCSRLRRGQLHAAANELHCTKIALGQHLDDLCVSLLMALFRGGGLKTMGANVAADAATKRLIRPLCTVRKSLIRTFAEGMGYPAVKSCPYEARLQEDGDRTYLERLLDQLSLHFKDIRGCMLKAMSDVRLSHLLDTRYLDEDDPDHGKL